MTTALQFSRLVQRLLESFNLVRQLFTAIRITLRVRLCAIRATISRCQRAAVLLRLQYPNAVAAKTRRRFEPTRDKLLWRTIWICRLRAHRFMHSFIRNLCPRRIARDVVSCIHVETAVWPSQKARAFDNNRRMRETLCLRATCSIFLAARWPWAESRQVQMQRLAACDSCIAPDAFTARSMVATDLAASFHRYSCKSMRCAADTELPRNCDCTSP